MITVFWDIDVENSETLTAVIERAAQAAMEALRGRGDVDIDLADDGRVHGMNLEYRSVDSTTDVLSFPAEEGEEIAAPPHSLLGDIIISYPRAVAQAAEYGHSLERELSFLTTHGMLHLMGYDHMQPEDEREMLAVQKEILEKLGVKR